MGSQTTSLGVLAACVPVHCPHVVCVTVVSVNPAVQK